MGEVEVLPKCGDTPMKWSWEVEVVFPGDVKGPAGHSPPESENCSSFVLKSWEWGSPRRPQSHYPILTLSFKRMVLDAETFVIPNGRGSLPDVPECDNGQVSPSLFKGSRPMKSQDQGLLGQLTLRAF